MHTRVITKTSPILIWRVKQHPKQGNYVSKMYLCYIHCPDRQLVHSVIKSYIFCRIKDESMGPIHAIQTSGGEKPTGDSTFEILDH